MTTVRPWRAVAYFPAPGGRRTLGRSAARSRAGLDRFIAQWQEVGASINVWEVLPLPGVTPDSQVATGPPG